MKKKILGGLAVLTIAVVAAFNVNVNMQKNGLSDISLDNVEALASEGSITECYLGGCYISIFADCWLYKWGTPYMFCPNSRG